jgi:AcrR family transcriptional regulator
MAWIRAGLAVLSERGSESVRVELLARELKVTKGSFYWHFATRDHLLSAMIEEWERSQTGAVIDEVESGGGDAHRRLEALSASVGRLDMRLEAAMRNWAMSDPRARQSIERIDTLRLAYLGSIIEGAGVPQDHAKARARLVYYALIGHIGSGQTDWQTHHRDAMALNRAMILRWPQA